MRLTTHTVKTLLRNSFYAILYLVILISICNAHSALFTTAQSRCNIGDGVSKARLPPGQRAGGTEAPSTMIRATPSPSVYQRKIFMFLLGTFNLNIYINTVA